MSLLSISFKILVWFDVAYQLPLNYRYIAFVIFPRCLGYEQPYFIIQVSFLAKLNFSMLTNPQTLRSTSPRYTITIMIK